MVVLQAIRGGTVIAPQQRARNTKRDSAEHARSAALEQALAVIAAACPRRHTNCATTSRRAKRDSIAEGSSTIIARQRQSLTLRQPVNIPLAVCSERRERYPSVMLPTQLFDPKENHPVV